MDFTEIGNTLQEECTRLLAETFTVNGGLIYNQPREVVEEVASTISSALVAQSRSDPSDIDGNIAIASYRRIARVITLLHPYSEWSKCCYRLCEALCKSISDGTVGIIAQQMHKIDVIFPELYSNTLLNEEQRGDLIAKFNRDAANVNNRILTGKSIIREPKTQIISKGNITTVYDPITDFITSGDYSISVQEVIKNLANQIIPINPLMECDQYLDTILSSNEISELKGKLRYQIAMYQYYLQVSRSRIN